MPKTKGRLTLDRLRKLESIYEKLPKLQCKRRCQDSCGPIQWSDIENINIGKTLMGNSLKGNPKTFVCPYLQLGDCSIYHARPLICRLWGMVKAMQCPYGCIPERWLSRDEAFSLLQEVGTL